MIIKAIKGIDARDGAGVNLVRVLGKDNVIDFDPFLMLDSFDSYDPNDYIRGFPMHPHRGIETLTYLIKGEIDHEDTLGNKGAIGDGSAQWMTAGSGIEHQEMPQAQERLLGIQLWINLPAKEKMTIPEYFEINKEEIARKDTDYGVLRVLSGELDGVKGVTPRHLPVDFYDFEVTEGMSLRIPRDTSKNSFLFNILGDVEIGGRIYKEKTAMLTGESDFVELKAVNGDARVFFIQGPKLEEPIAWAGPIVMNTNKELQEAWMDLREGTFIRDKI